MPATLNGISTYLLWLIWLDWAHDALAVSGSSRYCYAGLDFAFPPQHAQHEESATSSLSRHTKANYSRRGSKALSPPHTCGILHIRPLTVSLQAIERQGSQTQAT